MDPSYNNFTDKKVTASRITYLETYKAIRNIQWLMQDGAPPHTALASRNWLARNFGDRVISLKTNFVWAPYSPDLNPLDFFLWGHLKDVVYRDVPLSLQELKDSITQHIHRINNDKDLCNRVILNFQKRIRLCLQRDGGHLEHSL